MICLVPIDTSAAAETLNPGPVSGSFSLSEGVSSFTATGLGIPFLGSYLVTLSKQNEDDDNISVYLQEGFTQDGFTVDFNEPLTTNGYRIFWIAVSQQFVSSVAPQMFTFSLSNGLSSYPVTGLALPFMPAMILAQVAKAISTDSNITAFPRGLPTPDGQVFDFNQPLPNGNYVLQIFCYPNA
jgi:hypothetical protein